MWGPLEEGIGSVSGKTALEAYWCRCVLLHVLADKLGIGTMSKVQCRSERLGVCIAGKRLGESFGGTGEKSGV